MLAILQDSWYPDTNDDEGGTTVNDVADTDTTPTWKAVEDRSREILRGMLELGVVLMNAADDERDPEVALGEDDADEVLGQLRDAWDAIYPIAAGTFVERTLAVWNGEKTTDEALGF